MSASDVDIPFVSGLDVLAAGITIPLVGITAVSLRFWQRSLQKGRVGADDYTILLALLFVVGMGICLIYGTAKKALGYPTPQLPNASAETQLTQIVPKQRLVELLDWITWLLMIPANGCIKLSAILFYRRVFVVNKWSTFDIVTRLSLIVMAMWTVAFFLATIFGCGKHFAYPWAPLLYISECNTNTRLDALMISDLMIDVFVWLLPIPVIWNLRMRTSRKLSVTGIMMLAAISLAAAVVRLIVQSQISNGGYAAHTDVDLTLTILLYWSMIESGLAVIAACLPTLHKLVAPSAIRSVLSGVRSALNLDSFRSHSPASSRSFKGDTYSEIERGTVRSKPSHREKFEAPENMMDVHGVQDLESGPQIPLMPATPRQIHMKNTSSSGA